MRNLSYILLLGLLASCGVHVDNPELIDKGYQHRRGDTIYRYHNTFSGIDSTLFTINSFVHVDTLEEFGVIILGLPSGGHPIPTINPKSKDWNPDIGKTLEYNRMGVGNLDGEIIIFPAYRYWELFPNGYVAFRKAPENESKYAVMSIYGEVITHFEYNSVIYDSANELILGNVGNMDDPAYDTIWVP